MGILIQLALIATAVLQAPAQEKPEEKLQGLLKKLSEVAREVDSGKRTLSSLLDDHNNPAPVILDFRSLLHEHPKLNPAVLTYLKSKDEPLGARALAVMALAHPYKDSVAELIASIYTEPFDHKLVVTAAFCYRNLNGGGFDWKYALQVMCVADLSPAWQFPPDCMGGPLRIIIGVPGDVNLNPILDALLKRLAKGETGVMKHMSLNLAWEFSQRKHAMDEHRQQVRSLMEVAYLEGGTGWHVATDYLTGMHGTVKKPDVKLLGRGLAKLDVRRQLTVMNEVATFDTDALFAPPFRDCIEKAIQHLSLPTKESGLEVGTMMHFLNALKSRAKQDAELKKLLENPTETLGLRLSGVVR